MGTRLDTSKETRLGMIIAASGALVLVMLLLSWSDPGWLNKWNFLKQILPRQAAAVHAGPSASWAEMLALARQEAAKIDKDALPSFPFVSAFSTSKWEDWRREDWFEWSYTDTLDVKFEFDTAKGSITVRMQDAAPAETLKIDNRQDQFLPSTYVFPRREYDKIAAAVDNAKLTPRDALLKTQAELEKYKAATGSVDAKFFPIVTLCDPDSEHAYWSVTYTEKGVGDSADMMPDVFFVVNAENGAVSRERCADIQTQGQSQP